MRKLVIAPLLVLLLLVGQGLGTVSAGPHEDFVTRFYSDVLERAPEPTGMAGWVGFLRANCNAQGFDAIARGFFDSPEFRTAKPQSLNGLVTLLYRTFLGREPDPGGLAGWAGLIRQARLTMALQGFIPSPEFQSLLPDRSNRAAVTAVVTRLYQQLLGRAPEPAGLDGWVNFIVATGNLEAAATGFLASQEFESHPLTSRDYVTLLYRTFLNRDPEPAGLDGWEGVLRNTLLQIINAGFVPSEEFQGLVRQVCGNTSAAVQGGTFLSAADVTAIVRQAAEALDATTMVIAVTDRMGNVLGVFRKPSAPSTATGNFGATVDANELAVALARTGAFFSNNQAPLSSRTVRFISGIHFPPGIRNKPNAALYGIENTNRGCTLNTTFNPGKTINPARALNGLPCNATDQRGCGMGIATGKADLFDGDPNAVNGAGIPIFKDGQVVGGIGVAGVPPRQAEFAAFVGSVPDSRFGPRPADPGVIFLEGIQLPFLAQATQPTGTGPGTFVGTFLVGPVDSPLGADGVPDGWLVGPLGSPELSAAEVEQIVGQAVGLADQARAAIRLPLGSTTRMMIAVTDLQGNILGLFRMADSTVFSIDVSVAKARNVVYFSSQSRAPEDLPGVPIGTAVTNRTISFGAQPLYPPGIDGSSLGPFFPLYVNDVATPCRQGSQPANLNQNGIVFFPGSMPLYNNGQLVGGLGVSGDGVEQDDLVTASGATGFAPPLAIRADQFFVGGIRLPLLKFPRNPLAR